MQDIRWIQRFANYQKAYAQLEEGVLLFETRMLTSLERQGLVQAFEFTHELAWKTLKDFLEMRGAQNLYGSRDVTREAFKLGLITDGEAWMAMINSRNETSHTYDEARADAIIDAIVHRYFEAFGALQTKLTALQNDAL